MIIYKAINQKNGKVYVGQTSTLLSQRKGSHLFCAKHKIDNCHFHNAIRYFGMDVFKWEVLCTCLDIDELNQKEREYIKIYDARNRKKGYNFGEGGEKHHMLGKHHSEETKAKISKANKGRKLSEEHKKKISETKQKNPQKRPDFAKLNRSRTDIKLSQSHKENVVKSLIKKWEDPEFRKKMSDIKKGKNNPMCNKKHTEESKKKMSDIKKGKKASKETKERLSKATSGKNNPMYGKKHSEESKKKMSETRKKTFRKNLK